MDSITPEMLRKAITAHPRASLQDALLVFCVMLVTLILALQYDLFFFIERLASAESRISLAEAIFLTVLLGGCLIAFTLRRISEQRRDSALKMAAQIELSELTALVMQDPLTRLFNRRALLTALTDATNSPPTNGTKNALFLIDLDHFKSVNDAYGHAVGDEVLEALAGRFKAAARPSDLVARIGGDEFAVIAYNVDREAARKLSLRFVNTADEILRNADLAMYRAKAQGESLLFFEPGMEQKRQIA